MTSKNPILGTQKLRRVASKVFQKLKPSSGKEYMNLEEHGPTDTRIARFVTFVRPKEAPQTIDLKAMRQSIRQQPTLIYTHASKVPRSQADLKKPELRLQKSFEIRSSPTETGTPLRKNPQQAFVFGATLERSAATALDDIADYASYEFVDEEEVDMDTDWNLLDLPESVYTRLLSESRHSLI